MTRPAKVIDQLIRADPQLAADQTVATIAPPIAEAPCCNPTCVEQCSWENTRGRPKRFCSNLCRTAFTKQRTRLLADLAQYELLLAEGQPSSRTKAMLENRIARLKMHLDRYRPFPTGDK